MRRWTDEEDALILKTPHLTTAEVAARIDRTVPAVAHRRSSLGRKHAVLFGSGPKGAWIVGKRRLLARTCAKCGLLLGADRFGLTDRGTWRAHCVHCRAVDELSRKRPYEPSEAERERARINQQKLQALSLPGAVNHRQPWTEADHKVLADPELTGLEKALRLGRTYMAVASQCRDHGYYSKVGKGDPIKGRWVIDNPNEPERAAC